MGKKVKYISTLLSYVLIVCLIMGLFPAATFAKSSTQMTEAAKPTKKTVSMTEAEKPQTKKTMQVTDVETQKTHEVEIEQPKKDQITETTTQTMQQTTVQTTTVNNVNNNIMLTEDITGNCNGTHPDTDGWKGLSIPTTYLESGKYYLENDLRVNITIPANKTVVLCLNEHKIIGVANNSSVITVNGNFTLCDCKGTGQITSGNAQKGGGVFVNDSATFTMNGGVITNNTVTSDGGGVYVERNGTFIMNGGTISSNKAGFKGGGLFVQGSFAMRNNSEISDNISYEYGGGLFVSGGTFNMTGGTITKNKATGSLGGGVYITGDTKNTFTMSGNSIISHNEAKTSAGGVYVNNAIFNMDGGTISENHAKSSGGGIAVSYGTLHMNGDSKILENTVLSDGNIAGGGVYVENGTFTMNSNSEIGSNRILNENPDSTHWTNSFGGGAYIKDSTFTMNDTSTIQFNQTDLNRASCSSYCYGGGVYVDNSIFAITGSSSITGNSALPNIPAIGGGAYVKNSTFTMSDDSTISNNEGNSKGGGVFVQGGEFTMTGGTINHNNIHSGTGGGVAIEGNDTIFTMENGTISNNSAAMGGGIAVSGNNSNNTTFTMKNGTISGNNALSTYTTSGHGGGVYIAGNRDNRSTFFNMEGGTISDNKTSFGGGGVAVLSGEFTMTGGTISDNSVNSNFGGGGVYVNHSIFNMTNSTISDNSVNNCDGGGVAMEDGSIFNMTDSTISGNTASRGGGVSIGGSYPIAGGTFNMTNSTINDNTTNQNGGGVAVLNGIFIMRSGSIVENLCDSDGGGVYVASSSQFHVSDTPIITDNIGRIGTGTQKSSNNVYLENIAINIIGALKENAKIGVTAANPPQEEDERLIAESYSSYTATEKDKERFASDNPKYKVTFYEHFIYLALPSGDEKTVTFDYQCNDIENKEVFVDSGDIVAKPTDPTRNGFTFGGWYTDADCTYGNEWDFATDIVTEDTILYAKWTENENPTPTETVTVEFDSQGGSTVANQIIEKNEKVTKPADPNYTGYTFGGWYKEAECTNAWDFATDTVTENTTLYAKWMENPYTVTFVIEGSTVSSQTVERGQKITEPTLSRDGYTLDGWYTDNSFTNKWNFDTSITGDMTLYAKWTENENPTPQPEQFTVDFNSNGGSTVPSQTVTKNETVTEPTAPTRNGFTFDGWYTDEACTARNKWDFGTLVVQNLTLYAKWEQNKTDEPIIPDEPEQFTVTFDTNGGSAISAQTVEAGKVATMPENPTKNGYEFLGWFADKDFNQIFQFSTPITKDITLYAKWAEKKTEEPSKPGEIITPVQPSRPRPITPTPTPTNYTVTFDSNGGSEIASQTVESGKTATLPEDPTRGGYTFLGWFTDKDFNEVYRFSTPVTENITIYAKWKEKSHSSSGGGGGGSSSSSKSDTGRTGTWVTEEPKTIQPVAQYQVTKPDCPRDETCPLSKFVDVNKWAWYHDGSHYCVEHNLIIGTSNITFSPDMPITRGMVVAILWRMEDKPIVNDIISFQDVKETAYYAEAVRWAAHNNIVSGYSNTKFGPNDDITREQMASILYRYTKYKNKDVNGRADISNYEDSNDISNYAIAAMQWACDTGIIKGISTTLLSPKGTTTRAQAAQMFYMYLKK